MCLCGGGGVWGVCGGVCKVVGGGVYVWGCVCVVVVGCVCVACDMGCGSSPAGVSRGLGPFALPILNEEGPVRLSLPAAFCMKGELPLS